MKPDTNITVSQTLSNVYFTNPVNWSVSIYVYLISIFRIHTVKSISIPLLGNGSVVVEALCYKLEGRGFDN
jgi:hypothetical protein